MAMISKAPKWETERWPRAESGSVIATAPSVPVVPSVSISAPASASRCDSVVVDLSGSQGGGGRSWVSKSVSVLASNGNSTLLNVFFSHVYIASSVPLPIPLGLLQAGVSYTFVVTLCNFLGACGQGRKTIVVLSGSAPSVTIIGPAVRSIYRNSTLSLTSNSFVSACSGGVTTQDLSYQWSLSPVISSSSTSRDPSVFLLRPFVLVSNTEYSISLTVTIAATGIFSTISVQVLVQSGAIIPVIPGGSSQSLRLLGSLELDASRSMDTDVSGLVGPSAGLAYEWSCFQTGPTVSSVCSIDIFNVTGSVLSVVANLEAANTTSAVSLVLGDNSGLRTAQSSLTISVVSPVSPLVTIGNSSTGKVNPSSKLLFVGTVSLSAASTGTVFWSVDNTVINIEAISLVPVSRSLEKSVTSILLLVKPNSLSPGSEFTFVLTASTSTGEQTAATITIVTNAPPTPGTLSVTPTTGVAMVDIFTYNAALWVDEDAPISYQLGFVSPSTGSVLTVQSKSEMSFGSSLLPSGSGPNSLLTCVGDIYDSYDANFTAYTIIQVNASSLLLSDALAVLNVKLSGVLASVNGVKKMVSLATSVLNLVNCSAVGNCSLLNRFGCQSVSNTCGPCLDGFVGSSGDGNTLCLNIADAASLIASEGGSSINCSTHTLCPVGYECDQETAACVIPPKNCVNDCSDHGACIFIQASTGYVLDACTAYSVDCFAQCECDESWHGDDCSIDSKEIVVRQAARADLATQLANLVGIENPSESAINGWLAGLVSISTTAADMTNGSITSVQLVSDYIIGTAAGVGMPADSILSLLDIADSGASTVSLSTSSGRRARDRRKLANDSAVLSAVRAEAVVASTTSLLSRFGKFATSSMVTGQVPLTSIKSTFRLSSQLVTDVSTVSIPATALETVAGVVQPSVQLSSVVVADGTVSVSMLAMSSALYNNRDFLSNPLRIQLTSNSFNSCDGDDGVCEAVVVLRNSNPVGISDSMMAEYTTLCMFDDYSLHTYMCPDGRIAVAQCNGSAAVIFTRCPYIQQSLTCTAVVGLSSGGSECRTVSFTDDNVTCACPISVSARRLEVMNDDNNDQGSTVSVDLVSMSSFLGTEMLQTWSSAGDLRLSSLKRGWNVILTVGILVALTAISVYSAHHADQKSKMVLPTVDSDLAKAAWTLKSRGSTVHKKDQRRAQKLRKRIAQEDERVSIENSLPSILRSSSFKERFIAEVKRFHRWFGVVFHFSPYFPRVLRIVSLVCSVVTMLFVQAVTYKLSNPDDGSCERLTTEAACTSPRSVYDTSQSKCYWTHGYRQGSCHFVQPSDSLKVVLFVAIFAAILSTPISVTTDWVVMNILAASTTEYRSGQVGLDSVRAVAGPRHKAILPVVNNNPNAAENSPALLTTLQDDLDNLIIGLRRYREILSVTQRKEFDELWGLDKDGQFQQASARAPATRSWLMLRNNGKDNSIESVIKEELRGVRRQLANEFDIFSLGNRDARERGSRLLFLFQKDLMPGVNGQILEAKQKRDAQFPSARSPGAKLVGWLFIVCLNLAMLFYIMLFALQETRQRQSAWFKSFVTWFFLDVFFVSTGVVYVTHVLIPMVIMRDVAKIKGKLLATMRDHYTALKRAKNGDNDEGLPESFNAAEHLFVSYRLAKLFPALGESNIILRYSTVWPKQSYHHHVDVTKSYRTRRTALSKAVALPLIFVLTNLLSIPPALQDMAIHIASTAVVGYTALLHMQLFAVYPALVAVPTILILVIAHFVIKGSRARAKAELARMMPVEEKTRRSVDVDKAPLTADSVNIQIAAGMDGCKSAVGSATFITRRQSLMAGHTAMREMLAIVHSEEAKENVIEADVEHEESSASEAAAAKEQVDAFEQEQEAAAKEPCWYTPSSAFNNLQIHVDDVEGISSEDDDESYSGSDDNIDFPNLAGLHLPVNNADNNVEMDPPLIPEVSHRYISSVLSRVAQRKQQKRKQRRVPSPELSSTLNEATSTDLNEAYGDEDVFDDTADQAKGRLMTPKT